MGKTFNLYSLNVGQGMCTYLEILDKSKAVIANAVFDLGGSSRTSGPAMALLVRRIKARNSPNGRLDALFLSHKDSDHVSLIPALLQRLPNLFIREVRYGGQHCWYKKSKGNILDILKLRGAAVSGFSIGAVSFDPKTKTFSGPIWHGDGFAAYLLAANTPTDDEATGDSETDMSKTPDGDQANSKSLVIRLSVGSHCAIISGDATFPTFQFVNSYYDQTMDNTFMLVLPHHASRKTTFGLPATSAKISKVARDVVDTFAENMAAQTLIASAQTRHGHPSLETINLFLQYADDDDPWWSDPLLDDMHYVTAYYDYPDRKSLYNKYVTFQSEANVYSTLYFYKLTNPPVSYPPLKVLKGKPLVKLFSTGKSWQYTGALSGLFKPILRGLAGSALGLEETETLEGAVKPSQVCVEKLTSIQMIQPFVGVPRPALPPCTSPLSCLQAVR